MITKGFHINTIMLSKVQYTVSTYTFMIILIKDVTLLNNRDLIFKPEQLDTLILSAYIINYNLTHIIIRNNIDLPVILLRYTRLDRILEYKTTECF